MKVFAEHFRGFKYLEVDLNKMNFLIGDNSSGKSSLIYLIDAMSKSDLTEPPRFDENFGVSEYDYFSPYFNYSDVIFGYSAYDEESKFSKIITVKQQKNAPPLGIKCSYFFNDRFLSFETKGKAVFYKNEEYEYFDEKKCIDDHKIGTGYKKIKNAEEFSILNPNFIIANLDYKSIGIQDNVTKIYKYVLALSRLVSPIRALPEKFYTFRRKFDAHGLHFATMWMDFFDTNKSGPFSDVQIFGKESGLFDKIVVRKISKNVPESPLIVSVIKSDKEFFLNQVGVGVSQVVPVLIETIFSLRGEKNISLIQQPELHLHPVAQAALGSYFYKACKNGLRGAIETHSSFLIDRFRSDLRTSNENSEVSFVDDSVEILFCQNSADGNKIERIQIDSSGALINDPEDYHKFFIEELIRTMF